VKDPPLGEWGALSLLRVVRPDLEWRSVRYVDEGWDHEVLLLDERLVVRIPNDEHYRRMLHAERIVLSQRPTASPDLPVEGTEASGTSAARAPGFS